MPSSNYSLITFGQVRRRTTEVLASTTSKPWTSNPSTSKPTATATPPQKKRSKKSRGTTRKIEFFEQQDLVPIDTPLIRQRRIVEKRKKRHERIKRKDLFRTGGIDFVAENLKADGNGRPYPIFPGVTYPPIGSATAVPRWGAGSNVDYDYGHSTPAPDCCFSLLVGWITLGTFVCLATFTLIACFLLMQKIRRDEKDKCIELLEDYDRDYQAKHPYPHAMRMDQPYVSNYLGPMIQQQQHQSIDDYPHKLAANPNFKLDQLMLTTRNDAKPVTTDVTSMAAFLDYLASFRHQEDVLERPPRTDVMFVEKDYKLAPPVVQKLVARQKLVESNEGFRPQGFTPLNLPQGTTRKESAIAASELKPDPSVVINELEDADRRHLNKTRSAPRRVRNKEKERQERERKAGGGEVKKVEKPKK